MVEQLRRQRPTMPMPLPGVSSHVAPTSNVAARTAVPAAVGATDALQDAPVFTHHDARYSVGVTALTGPTMTAVPRLLEDWRAMLLDAAAQDAAVAENSHFYDAALQAAENGNVNEKGRPLTRREQRSVRDDVQLSPAQQQQLADSASAYLAQYNQSDKTKKSTEDVVLLAMRPELAGLRDPFTPVAQQKPGARDNEIILWEHHNLMVVVDTFAPSPKALVVPKTPVALPVDAPAGMLEELAVVAAHVSDAFSKKIGSRPAGIWINPPQHLTVRQLHVHVMPRGPDWTPDRTPLRALLADPKLRPAIQMWFADIAQELAAKLGPATP